MSEISIRFFDDREVRTIWDEENFRPFGLVIRMS